MYTDGITEAMSPAAEIYGGARLEAILAGANSGSLHDLLHAVRADVAHHVAGAEASDDLTLLLIRWTPPLDPAVGQ
jgi:serine phosphatase RsbU (regulator of sigma subunit)